MSLHYRRRVRLPLGWTVTATGSRRGLRFRLSRTWKVTR